MKPENPYKGDIDIFNNIRLATRQGWQEGFDAAIKWLNEPCTEHPLKGVSDLEKYNDYKHYYPDHRYLCPECLKEISDASIK